MAPKRAAKKAAPPPPPPPPPPAESSDDESQSRSHSEDSEDQEVLAESPISASTPVLKNTPAPAHKGHESESSDEEEEEDEEEPAPAVPKNQPPPPQNKVDSDASGSDEEEEEDGDEEEEEEPTRAAPPSAPAKQPPQPQIQEDSDTSGDEEDEEAPPQSPPEPAPKKVAEVPKPPAAAAETKKRGPFERMWSTNDDVRILSALAAHQKQHGALPQPEALVDVLAGKLDKPAYGSKELQNKVKSLRTRYLVLSKRGQLPSKEHDRRVLDLSKLVWASDSLTSPVDAAAANAVVNGHEPKGFQEMCGLYPHLAEEVKGLEAAHPGICKREFGKMDDDKARAMDQKIKKQRVMQIKVEMRHADLVKEVTKALLDLVDS